MSHCISAATSELKSRVRSKEATVCVIGLGYVGLPVAVRFAEVGFRVVGVDIKDAIIAGLQACRSHVHEVSHESLQNLQGRLTFLKVEPVYDRTPSEIRQLVAQADIFIICVPTPLHDDGRMTPDDTYVRAAFRIVDHCHQLNARRARLAVVESTTYPGCTAEIFESIYTFFHRNMHVAYSPERIDPGRGVRVADIPKVIGADSIDGTELATELYTHFCLDENGAPTKDKLVRVSSSSAAETVKCTENAYRLMAISFANEIARFAPDMEVDAWQLIDAVQLRADEVGLLQLRQLNRNRPPHFVPLQWHTLSSLARGPFHKSEPIDGGAISKELVDAVIVSYQSLTSRFLQELSDFCNAARFGISYDEVLNAILTKPYGIGFCRPGPGAGGHCIPIDPVYLAYRARAYGVRFRVVEEAVSINEVMPLRIVELVGRALVNHHRSISGSKILVLGVAYKANVADLRESKALEIVRHLIAGGAEVWYCDPVFSRRQRELYRRKGDAATRSLALAFRLPGTSTQSLTQRCVPREVDLKDVARKGFLSDNEIAAVIALTDHHDFLAPEIRKSVLEAPEVVLVDARNCLSPGARLPNLYVWGRPVTQLGERNTVAPSIEIETTLWTPNN